MWTRLMETPWSARRAQRQQAAQAAPKQFSTSRSRPPWAYNYASETAFRYSSSFTPSGRRSNNCLWKDCSGCPAVSGSPKAGRGMPSRDA